MLPWQRSHRSIRFEVTQFLNRASVGGRIGSVDRLSGFISIENCHEKSQLLKV
jgi:hypothetical protein